MKNSRQILKDACNKCNDGRPPIWLMRQAGRYMADYRKLREKHSFMQLCHDSDLATEITLQPLKKFDMDAAILFCDILVTAEALGAQLDIVEKKGPIIANPVNDENALNGLVPTAEAAGSLSYVETTLQQIRSEIGSEKGLLGFVGAPFTVASYMIEGSSSSQVPKTFSMIHNNPEVFSGLLSKLVDVTVEYVEMQRRQDVDAVQIFESWASLLPDEVYLKHVFPHLENLVSRVYHKDKPLIMFALARPSLWPHLAKLPAQILSIGPDHSLGNFRANYPEKAFQGNLDSRWLLCPESEFMPRVDNVLQQMQGEKGYIFNLGHGLLPPTPEDHVARLVDKVRSL